MSKVARAPFRLIVRAMKKQTITTPEIAGFNTGQDPMTRICAHEGCDAEAMYPAPRSRSDLRDYIWFCLDHVREYNKGWNYFEGLDEIGMEEAIRKSTTWERPSWKFGTSRDTTRHWRTGFDDPFGTMGGDGSASRQDGPKITEEERQAWSIFGLSPCMDGQTVKKRYKELAKAHHPDANGGSKEAEDRLKSINWAYSILKRQFNGEM
jgi:hypothetical protein